MNRLLSAASCFALLYVVSCVPDGGPQKFTKISTVHTVKEMQRKEYSTSAFRPTVAYADEDDSKEDFDVAASQVRRPSFSDENYPIPNAIPLAQLRPQPRPQPLPVIPKRPSPPQPQPFRQPLEETSNQIQQARPLPRPPQGYARRPSPAPQLLREPSEQKPRKEKLEEEDEEKEEEPDRLSILLPQSKFECVGKNTGYYADENLGCEVFHYCHENVKHSWICPDGFTFHQVHLICMPPGADNICEKSSQFHFVNEYLYKPVNLEEHQNKPNVSLRYSERYYPQGQYNTHLEEDYEDEEPQPKKIPIKVQQSPAPVRRPSPSPFTPTYRPQANNQVFRSPEEINIPLQQRRPQYSLSRFLGGEDPDF